MQRKLGRTRVPAGHDVLVTGAGAGARLALPGRPGPAPPLPDGEPVRKRRPGRQARSGRGRPGSPAVGASVMMTRVLTMRRLRITLGGSAVAVGLRAGSWPARIWRLRIVSRIRKPPSVSDDHGHRARGAAAGLAGDQSSLPSCSRSCSCSPSPPCPPRRWCGSESAHAPGPARPAAATTGRGGAAATTGGGGARRRGSRAWRLLGGLRLAVDAHRVPDHLGAHLDGRRLLRRWSHRRDWRSTQSRPGPRARPALRPRQVSSSSLVWFTLGSLIRWSLLRQSCSRTPKRRTSPGEGQGKTGAGQRADHDASSSRAWVVRTRSAAASPGARAGGRRAARRPACPRSRRRRRSPAPRERRRSRLRPLPARARRTGCAARTGPTRSWTAGMRRGSSPSIALAASAPVRAAASQCSLRTCVAQALVEGHRRVPGRVDVRQRRSGRPARRAPRPAAARSLAANPSPGSRRCRSRPRRMAGADRPRARSPRPSSGRGIRETVVESSTRAPSSRCRSANQRPRPSPSSAPSGAAAASTIVTSTPSARAVAATSCPMKPAPTTARRAPGAQRPAQGARRPRRCAGGERCRSPAPPAAAAGTIRLRSGARRNEAPPRPPSASRRLAGSSATARRPRSSSTCCSRYQLDGR